MKFLPTGRSRLHILRSVRHPHLPLPLQEWLVQHQHQHDRERSTKDTAEVIATKGESIAAYEDTLMRLQGPCAE